MKINFVLSNNYLTNLAYTHAYFSNSFSREFFQNGIDFNNLNRYKLELESNNYFSHIKSMALRVSDIPDVECIFPELSKIHSREIVDKLRNNIDNRSELYKKFLTAESVLVDYYDAEVNNVNILICPFENNLENKVYGLTNTREQDFIIIFVRNINALDHAVFDNYTHYVFQVLLHELAHLHFYKSEIFTYAKEKANRSSDKKIFGDLNEVLARVFLAPDLYGICGELFRINDLYLFNPKKKLNKIASLTIKHMSENGIKKINNSVIDFVIKELSSFEDKD